MLGLMDAGRIQKHDLGIIRVHNAHNTIASCLGSITHNGDFFANQAIGQSGFAHIGTTHHGHKASIMLRFFLHAILLL